MGVGLESAKDLLHQDRYTWGFVGDSFLEYLMRNNRDKLYTDIANGGIKAPKVMSQSQLSLISVSTQKPKIIIQHWRYTLKVTHYENEMKMKMKNENELQHL
eukprot:sb/3478414/